MLTQLSVLCLFVSLFINLYSQLNGVECSTILREFPRDGLISACAEFCLWNAYLCVCIDYPSRNLVWFGAYSNRGGFFRTVVTCAVEVHVMF